MRGWIGSGENCCLLTQSYPTLCDLKDCRTSGFSFLHHLPEFSQTHVHWVSGAIQTSHPLLLGSSPGGSRVIQRWGRSRRPGKNLFNYRYRGRLETDSVVGELVEKRGWITGLRGIPITTYVGHGRLSILPKERRHWGLPGPISETQAELAGLVSTHISDGNSARKTGSEKEMTRGNQSFQKLIRFLYFSGLFIYLFVRHRDEYRVTRGSADLTLVTIRCFI